MTSDREDHQRKHRSALTTVVALSGLLLAQGAFAQQVVLMSKGFATTSDSGGGSVETEASVSADGNLVVFVSEATDLVPGQIDPPRSGACVDNADVFLYNRGTGERFLMSHKDGDDKTAADCGSYAPKISADGSWVAFVSTGTNLVSGQVDTNNGPDLFLYDVSSAKLTLVSHASGDPKTAASGLSGENGDHSISGDGKRVAFTSDARDLLTGFQDNNGAGTDVYLYDQASPNEPILVSHQAGSATKGGTSTTGSAEDPAISADGRLVAFTSTGSDHAAGQADTTGFSDVFLFVVGGDPSSDITLVSYRAGNFRLAADGPSQAPVITKDGKLVAYESRATDLVSTEPTNDQNGGLDVFLFDASALPGSQNLLVSRQAGQSFISGNGESSSPSIDGQGQVVAFMSRASDLITTDANVAPDVYRFDVGGLRNFLVSHILGDPNKPGNGESGTPLVSADASRIAYASNATDLVSGLPADDGNGTSDMFVYDIGSDQNALASRQPGSAVLTGNGASGDPSSVAHSISGDGKFVAFTSDASDLIAAPFADGDGVSDVFVFDGSTNVMASVRATGGAINGANQLSQVTDRPRSSVSTDGRYAAFVSLASNLVDGGTDSNGGSDVFLYDRVLDTTVLVSHIPGNDKAAGNDTSDQPVVSADGKLVLFRSLASNLIDLGIDTPGTNDVFLYDVGSGKIALVSHVNGDPKTAANGASSDAVISRDNRFVAFSSAATNLAAGDTNTLFDIYRYDVGADAATFISRPNVGGNSNGNSTAPVIDRNGDAIAFESTATNLVAGADVNGAATDVFQWSLAAVPPLRIVSGGFTSTSDGASSQPSISDDGQLVTFLSTGRNLVAGQIDPGVTFDVFVWQNNEVKLVSRAITSKVTTANGVSDRPLISPDGKWIAYQSLGRNLLCAQNDTNSAFDVFLFDMSKLDTTPACPDDTTIANTLVSHTVSNVKQAAAGASVQPSISDDGAFVAFASSAPDLAPGQVESAPAGDSDVFVWSRGTGTSVVASRRLGSSTVTGNDSSGPPPVISGNGAYVAFDSVASDLIASDPNGFRDAFLFFTPSADLSIVKTDGVTTVVAGTSTTYTITVTNNGPADVVGATVVDDFPNAPAACDSLSSITWTCSASPGASCTASGTGDLNDTVNIPAGGSVVYTAVAQTHGSVPVCGQIQNTASVTPPIGVLDPNLANNVSQDVDDVVAQQDIAVTVTDVPDPVAVGGIVTYVVTVTNSGPSDGINGQVNITIPELAAGATIDSIVPSPLCAPSGPTTIQCGTANITFSPGFPFVITIKIKAQATPGFINITATATVQTESGPLANNTAVEQTVVAAAASGFIDILTATSVNGKNTLEWLAPAADYNRTLVCASTTGFPAGYPCPGFDITPPPPGQPLAGAKGLLQHTGLTNGVTYYYSVFVETASLAVSAPKHVKARPFNNAPTTPEEPVQWAFATGGTSVTAPTVGPNGVLAVSNDRGVYGMQRGSAGGLWPTAPAFWPLRLQDIAQTRSPIVALAVAPGASRVAYIGSQDGTVYAVDADRGSNSTPNPYPVWQSGLLGTASVEVQAAPAGIFKAFGSGLVDDFILVGSRESGPPSNFYGLQMTNPGGGSIKWTYTGGADPIGIVSGGAAVDYPTKRVYFASRQGSTGKSLWCIDLTVAPPNTCAGPGTWPKALNDFDQSPVLRGGRLYIGNNASSLTTIDLATGVSLPSVALGDGPVKGFIFPDRLSSDLYLTTTNRVWALTDSGPTLTNKIGWPGAGIATIPNPSIPLFSRIPGGNFVWVGSSNGRLYQIDTTNPANIKSVLLGGGGSVIGAPSLDLGNSIVVVGSDSGVIYAVKVPLP